MFIAMTRPRRFGKTVMAHMLAAYYSCGCDSRELFEGLKITRYNPKKQQLSSVELGGCGTADFHSGSEKVKETEPKPVTEVQIDANTVSDGENIKCENADSNKEYRATDNTEREAEDRAESNEESLYEKYLNKSNVIYWDMNTVQAEFRNYLSEDEFYIRGVDDIVDYLQYATLSEIKNNEKFGKILAETPMIGKKNLFKAITAISEVLDITFVLIMDEWDLIYREYRDDEQLQKKFIDLLKDLFKSDGGSKCFSLVYLTGILPIKKYNSQSGLNIFHEYTMMSPAPYEEYFGFTEEEVSQICRTSIGNISLTDLREWYEGYKLNNKDIYNPNSVVQALRDGKCKSYWSGTSSNEEFINLINMNFKGIKNDIVRLINGARLPFKSVNFENDMVSIKDRNDVFCLLTCLGYLGCRNTGTGLYEAYIPNREIRETLASKVKSQEWSGRMNSVKRSERLLKAIIRAQDGEKVAGIIDEIHNSPDVSLLDYNSELSLTYCVMTGLMWATTDIYVSHREDQTGNGRADLVYEPVDQSLPVIIIEFKYGESAGEAIEQIKSKEYYKRYAEKYRHIVLAGISYSKETKKHQCLLEKLDHM